MSGDVESVDRVGSKRKRTPSPPPWRAGGRGTHDLTRRQPDYQSGRSGHHQVRINQIQEEERMREWVAQEDQFVLKQAKKRAEIRVRDGRAKPIDWLCCTLHIIDPVRNPLDDEADKADTDILDPSLVFEDLSKVQLVELQKDIDTYMQLEKSAKNKDYWRTMKVICKDFLRKLAATGPEGRAVSSVSADIDRLLGPKSYEELESLEDQIRTKLASNEPIDTDYWQQLLESLLVWKARAKLRQIYESVTESRHAQIRNESAQEALKARQELVWAIPVVDVDASNLADASQSVRDPDSALLIRPEDKGLEAIDEADFLRKIAINRRKISKQGPVSSKRFGHVESTSITSPARHTSGPTRTPHEGRSNDDFSLATKALFNKEVARGCGEDEEIFTAEEEVETKNKDQWMGQYRPRKPKYFNRVQMGYEWNKYNQTHYDHENPPPKVVQGYKFHIFYPELIDKTKAPTYRIEREGGRKKGQSTAPAGEEDTCIIKFIAGPPYETIAFKIIDRDWDYSAKYDRGFKSTFEAGVLSLHFSFKKIYYRK